MEQQPAPIGVFDSGYGGLTVLKEIVQALQEYDFIYLGDNARSPYGTRSFETVYQYTLEAVEWFFEKGCPLVVLACNTASAKALRTIQQRDLPRLAPENRVLGVIRPTTELLGTLSQSGSVGILATRGTVNSNSYPIELNNFFPQLKVYQEACPLWVPLIENNEHLSAGADYFVKKHLDALFEKSDEIDTVLLACTHYPLLSPKILAGLPSGVRLLGQGEIVAESLKLYLNRHPEMKERLSRGSLREFFTTDDPFDFEVHASEFYGKPVSAKKVVIDRRVNF